MNKCKSVVSPPFFLSRVGPGHMTRRVLLFFFLTLMFPLGCAAPIDVPLPSTKVAKDDNGEGSGGVYVELIIYCGRLFSAHKDKEGTILFRVGHYFLFVSLDICLCSSNASEEPFDYAVFVVIIVCNDRHLLGLLSSDRDPLQLLQWLL